MAKVKFRFGIKSYSGTLDDLVYCNYSSRDVVIGRVQSESRELTQNNIDMGSKMTNIANLYSGASSAYKADLDTYAEKMFALPAYTGKLAGNKFSVFLKIVWAASQSDTDPVDLNSLNTDDILLGSYNTFETVSTAINNGFIPDVEGSELLTANIAG